uniref:Putative nadh:ubiquinone oxidoreductase ndufs6/13 kDa subunit n=1 Tax=Ixodes ricinus TaxID=34613 RepID=A0A0K8RAY8_IXORI
MRLVRRILEEPETTVAACMVARSIQVDEDPRVTQGGIPTIAPPWYGPSHCLRVGDPSGRIQLVLRSLGSSTLVFLDGTQPKGRATSDNTSFLPTCLSTCVSRGPFGSSHVLSFRRRGSNRRTNARFR